MSKTIFGENIGSTFKTDKDGYLVYTNEEQTCPVTVTLSRGKYSLSKTIDVIVPKVKEFTKENLQVNLAVSLHAPEQSLRENPCPNLKSRLSKYGQRIGKIYELVIIIVAVLFFADWCGFCKRFAPTFAELSKDRDLKKKDLCAMAHISSASLTKMKNNGTVTTDVLSKICNALDCDFSDIMELMSEEDQDNE